ncbi:hypothetical protein BH09PSE5_BH09PSE5_28290 [soil metagenome]
MSGAAALPKWVATFQTVAWQRRLALSWIVYAALLIAVPFVFQTGLGLALASQIGIAIIACLSFNLLLGQAGMLSFGHAVYTGLGAYFAIHALNSVGAGRLALPVSLVPLIGGVAGLVVAALLGYLTTRRAGIGFAMITLGIGELVFALASMMTGFFGGEGGVTGNRVTGAPLLGVTFGPPRELYFLIAAYCFVCTVAMYAFTRTPLGRLLNAVRENPERAAFIGMSTQRLRYLGFMFAGFFAGISGGLYALLFEIVTPDVLGTVKSGNYLLFTLLGGSTVFFGPIIGAVLMVLCSALLPELTRAWLLYLGLAFMSMMMVEPGGIAGLAARAWRRRFSTRPTPGSESISALPLDRFRSPAWRAASVACAMLAVLAAAALIEMTYRVQLDAALGSRLRFLGVGLDTSSTVLWLLLSLVMAGGVVTCWLFRQGSERLAARKLSIARNLALTSRVLTRAIARTRKRRA